MFSLSGKINTQIPFFLRAMATLIVSLLCSRVEKSKLFSHDIAIYFHLIKVMKQQSISTVMIN